MARKPKEKEKGKLPSGNVRVQVYWYTDDSGKRHYKSFTAPSKKEAKRLADEWKVLEKNKKPQGQRQPLTVHQAAERYIELKEAALSPSTVAAYEKNARNHISGPFGALTLSELTSADVQLWISDLVGKGLAPKTIRNIYGQFSSTADMFAPDLRLKVTLPAKKKPELYCPNDWDIKRVLEHIQGTELEIAVLLAAFGPLRRGEICALNSTDIRGNIVHVCKSKVMGPDRTWIIKQPKTPGSYRDVEFPDFVMERLEGIKGPIIKANPNQISGKFRTAIKKTAVPYFRFHDLRHYAASIMHAIGVPDQYILQRGGWSSDNVMKTVYRNVIDLETARQTRKINQHFDELNRRLKSV